MTTLLIALTLALLFSGLFYVSIRVACQIERQDECGAIWIVWPFVGGPFLAIAVLSWLAVGVGLFKL